MAVPYFSWYPLSWLVVSVLLLGGLMTNAHADVRLRDGGNHLIDYVIEDSVTVGGNFGGTRASLLPGSVITGSLSVLEDSNVWIEGGEVSGSATARDDGALSISGGVVGGDMIATDDGSAFLSGGIVRGDLVIGIASSGRIYVSGTDFRIDGQPIGSTTLKGPLDVILSGILSDGTPFANRAYFREPPDFGEIILETIPEPSSGTLSALGLTCLAWFCWRRRSGLCTRPRTARRSAV